MTVIEYKLEAFEGPLDLLLHLIEKNKVSIYDIPIVIIADQYIEYVSEMDHTDLDLVSDFLVMAATLLDIKARMLLPKEESESEEEDPREELMERLLEYKKYRYMSGELRDLSVIGEQHIVREQDLPDEVLQYRPPVDLDELLGGLTAQKLKKIFDEVMKRREDRKDPIRSRFGRIRRETVQISDKIKDLRQAVSGGKKRSFRSLLNQGATKVEVVVTFLAILELIKTGELVLTEDSTRDEFLVEAREGSPDVTGSEEPAGGAT